MVQQMPMVKPKEALEVYYRIAATMPERLPDTLPWLRICIDMLAFDIIDPADQMKLNGANDALLMISPNP